jgi:hypothetical protein
MNLAYLKEELEKLELTEFEATCYGLSQKLLSGDASPWNEAERNMYSYMVRCGVFGNEQIGFENSIQKQMNKEHVDARTAKRQLFLKRLFPDIHYYEKRAPFVYRYKILIPLYWVYRLIRRLRRGGMVSELKTWKN